MTAMSKHAVVGLSLGLRATATDTGVGIHVACPGVIETPILDKIDIAGLPTHRRAWRGPTTVSSSVTSVCADRVADRPALAEARHADRGRRDAEGPNTVAGPSDALPGGDGPTRALTAVEVGQHPAGSRGSHVGPWRTG
jgi:hypothetical protein